MVVFTFLEQRAVWSSPYYTQLTNGGGIGEVRINTEIPHRIFGYQNGTTFNVMIIGSHKERVYSPRDVIKTAKRRMREVQKGVARLVKCNRPSVA